MKRIFKVFVPFLLILLLCSFSASAAAPAAVKSLKATSDEGTVKLTWSKVSSAKGYNIYRVDNTTGKLKYYKSTSKNYYTINNCTLGIRYSFKVNAYNKAKEKGAYSNTASVVPKASAPATPDDFRQVCLGDKSVTLSWDKVKKASGYEIQRYYTDSKTWKTSKSVTSSTNQATIYNLTPNVITKFRVVSFRSVGGKKLYSAPSRTLDVKATVLSDAVKSVRKPRYKVKLKYNVTVSLKGGGTKYLKKGTAITVDSKKGSKVTGYLDNGKTFPISRSALKYTGLDGSSKNDYSKEVKTAFINSRGLKSNTRWLIWISEYKYKVNIFSGSQGNWKLRRVAPCVVGSWVNRTVGGEHKILRKVGNGEYGGPVMHFSRGEGTAYNPLGCAFHHVVDGTMSKAASHGCVRLYMSDLRYIYNNCLTGTTVYIY